jgi:hypothetical protein
MVAFLGFNSVTGAEFNNLPPVTNFTQEAPATTEVAPEESVSPSEEELANQKVVTENNSISFKASNTLFAGLAKDGTPVGYTVSDSDGNIGSINVSPASSVMNPDGYVLISYVQSTGANALNVLLSQSITVDGAGTSYSASPSVTIAGNWYPMTLAKSASNTQRLPNGNYLLTATLYVDSTVESGMFFDSTSGLDVDAIPGEISTRIIMDSSKSQILAQAINVSAKGVK